MRQEDATNRKLVEYIADGKYETSNYNSKECDVLTILTGRKRSGGVTDAPSIKKQRLVNIQQEEQIEPVIIKVVNWITINKSLPKTQQKLLRFLPNLCKILVRVDEEIIYSHLIHNQVIFEDGNSLVPNKLYNPERQLLSFPVQSGMPFDYDDFLLVLRKIIHWIITNPQLPKSKKSFKTVLKQFCTFKRTIPASLILEALVAKGIIHIEESSGEITVEYLNNISCNGEMMVE